jgi:hypothetical protein
MKLTIIALLIMRILLDPPAPEPTAWDDYDSSAYDDDGYHIDDVEGLEPDLWGDDYGSGE